MSKRFSIAKKKNPRKTTINSLRTVGQWIVTEIFLGEIRIYPVWHMLNSYTNVSRCMRRRCTCAHKLIDGNRMGRMVERGNKAEVNSSALTLFTGTTLFSSRPGSLLPPLTLMMNFGQNLAYVRAKSSCWWARVEGGTFINQHCRTTFRGHCRMLNLFCALPPHCFHFSAY